MTSWRLLASPERDARTAAAVVVAHLLAALLPWLVRLPMLPAVLLGLIALGLLAPSLRCLPRTGRLRAIDLEPDRCAIRTGDGWWPARLDPGCRVHRDRVLFRVATADGPVVAVLHRRSLDPASFRRLKVLIRARDGASRGLC